MSYEIIKSIKIKDNKVFIKSSSNNVFPKDWSEEECKSLSKILQQEGKQELDIEILKEFENGNFQSSQNLKYTRALKILKFFYGEEYKKFDWRTPSMNSDFEFKENRRLRESQAFKDLLLKALSTKLPKQKFIIKAKRSYTNAYVFKTTKRHIQFCEDISRAKKFDFRQQAESIAQHIQGEVLEFKQQNEYEVIK